ncbi:hypothetical protein PHYSODRAFT_302097 [Phytophthora sojae]|uniref:Uncharacterized protein n=1 Tax=Phytophthora sojae (strain P6497) TaxID=1094619 RepID=G4ZM12_PHYSP|nr:hypothetical protein PHYSODRAFT_302097 [Phytophthora sojae]EGZ15640.1 hypothetical protein PHYSODRAFT_302097 [Phytophthora sojae]|eukprot:XP_009529389.1 hypothetical protein PHYSODRAFT_302097 [Phytophthora sojae]
MVRVWFELVDRQGGQVATLRYVDLAPDTPLAVFKNAARGAAEAVLPTELDTPDLKVFANAKARQDQTLLEELNGSAPIPETATVERLLVALKKRFNDNYLDGVDVFNLHAYDHERNPLEETAQLGLFGLTRSTAIIVEVPARTRFREETERELDEVARKRRKSDPVTKWKWKEEEDPVYSLDEGTLYFVNRDRATRELVRLHKSNYNRAKRGYGDVWMIPLLDNISGIGKSQFGREYIRSCRRQWDGLPASDTDGDFLNIIRQSHTIVANFSLEHILREDMSFDMEKARGSFVTSIRAFFVENYGTTPRALGSIEANPDHVDILMKLAIEAGPLFIVIDDIASAFDVPTLDVPAKEDRFLEFCQVVLRPLFCVKHLFFLVVGRAPFLNYLSSSARLYQSGSYFTFRRLSLCFLRPPEIQEIIKKTYLLSLCFLRPPEIQEIIKKTYWDKKQVKTVQEQFKLDESQVKDVAEHLCKTTFGHPRSLLAAFRTCHSYQQLVKYEMPRESDKNWERQNVQWITQKKSLDLSKVWKDQRGEVSYIDTADMFGIEWAGNLNDAELFMPPYIQHAILSSVSSIQKLLEIATIEVGHD